MTIPPPPWVAAADVHSLAAWGVYRWEYHTTPPMHAQVALLARDHRAFTEAQARAVAAALNALEGLA